MKAVAAHAFRVEVLRDRVVIRQRMMRAVEGGVEAGDLRKVGRACAERMDRREVVGLMQRRQRRVALEVREHLVVDHDRLVVSRSAMNDPMADGDRLELLRRAQPGSRDLQRGRNVVHLRSERRTRSISCALSAASARSRGRVPMPSTCPLIRRRGSTPAIGAKDLELDAGRARIDDQDRVHRGSRRWQRRSFRDAHGRRERAAAQEARRERTESAREVRMIGTRAPSTMPAKSALAMNDRFFASMLPASRSGTTRICARPATSDLMPLIRAASGSIALSKASGPSRMPPVIWPRSAILHSAAASMVEGIFDVTVSTAERMRDPRRAKPDLREQVDRVLDDVALGIEVRKDVDRRVGDEQRLRIGRHVHDEDVTDATRGAQPGLSRRHLAHQLIGMQAALHQQLALGLADELDRLRRRRLGCAAHRRSRSGRYQAGLRAPPRKSLLPGRRGSER